MSEDLSPAADRVEQLTRQVKQLEIGLAGARTIGAAVGIVMSRHGLTYDDAFMRLCTISQQCNVKVQDLAERVVFTVEIPHNRDL